MFFVCFSTKILHLEIVSGLTKDFKVFRIAARKASTDVFGT